MSNDMNHTATLDDIRTIAVPTDEALALNYQDQANARHRADRAEDAIRRAAGQVRRYTRDSGHYWEGTLDSAINLVTITAASDTGHDARRLLDERRNAYQDLADLNDAAGDLNAVFVKHRGWTRFYLVTSSDGHIHSSMNCPTCRWNTEFAWLPTLSGLAELDAVVAHGPILCSVCFPTAPVEWTNGENKAVTEAKAARAAATKARQEAKLAKAITPTGDPIFVVTSDYDAERGRCGERIETIAAAKRELTDLMESWRRVTPVVLDARRTLAEAIAARCGTTVLGEVEAAAKRAAKRR